MKKNYKIIFSIFNLYIHNILNLYIIQEIKLKIKNFNFLI